MALSPGDLIDQKYRIAGLLGVGGMGSVYEGENIRIKRRVAIKVLDVNASEDVIERFQHEAQAAGTIGNDHILEVLDLGNLPTGEHYMVMEFLDGETLSKRIKSSVHVAPRDAVMLFRQMLSALQAVHSKGIIHRDLKPENVFILKEKTGHRDFVKIIDFGISKFNTLGGEFSKTRTGTVLGTPYYMSPEQATGARNIDHRTDLYAVGVMLFEAVCGQVPFDGATFNELMFKIALSEIPRPRALVPDLDPAFETIILKGMARDINHRFQTAAEFDQALANWQVHGQGVVVPEPSVQQHGAVPAAIAGRPSYEPQSPAMMHTTGGSNTWAQSQVREPTAKKSPPWLLLGGVAGVLGLAVVGGLFLLLRSPAQTPPADPDLGAQPTSSAAAPPSTAEQPAPTAATVTPPTASSAPEPEAKPTATATTGVKKQPPPGGPVAPRTKPRSDDDFGY